MTNELEPLKECPFCGSTDTEIRYDFMPDNMWMCKIACWRDAPAIYVECIGVGSTKDEAYEMAAGFWNTRYKRTCGEIRGDVYETPDGTSDDIETWCEHCDIVLDPDWLFCHHCGAEVVDGD